jgi:hypothetical protein
MIGLFSVIVAHLAVIVWWEYKRARGVPRSMSKAFRQHLASQATTHTRGPLKETKRGFDAWD